MLEQVLFLFLFFFNVGFYFLCMFFSAIIKSYAWIKLCHIVINGHYYCLM